MIAEHVKGVKPKRAAHVDDGQVGRRLHPRDARRHVANGAVGNRQEQQASSRHPEPRTPRHQPRVERAGEAAAEVAPARDR